MVSLRPAERSAVSLQGEGEISAAEVKKCFLGNRYKCLTNKSISM